MKAYVSVVSFCIAVLFSVFFVSKNYSITHTNICHDISLNYFSTGCSYHTKTFSPTGKFVATGEGYTTTKLFDCTSGNLIRELRGHSNFVSFIIFSKDEEIIITASHDGSVKIWNTQSGQLVKTLSFLGQKGGISSISLSDDKNFLAIKFLNNSISVYNLREETKDSIFEINKNFNINVSIIFDVKNNLLIIEPEKLQFIDLSNKSIFKEIYFDKNTDHNFIKNLIDPNCKYLAKIYNNRIAVIKIDDPCKIIQINGQRIASFSHYGNIIACVYIENDTEYVGLWSTHTGEFLGKLQPCEEWNSKNIEPVKYVANIQFSLDDSKIMIFWTNLTPESRNPPPSNNRNIFATYTDSSFNHYKNIKNKQILALACANHTKLGENSYVNNLSELSLQEIYNLIDTGPCHDVFKEKPN